MPDASSKVLRPANQAALGTPRLALIAFGMGFIMCKSSSCFCAYAHPHSKRARRRITLVLNEIIFVRKNPKRFQSLFAAEIVHLPHQLHQNTYR